MQPYLEAQMWGRKKYSCSAWSQKVEGLEPCPRQPLGTLGKYQYSIYFIHSFFLFIHSFIFIINKYLCAYCIPGTSLVPECKVVSKVSAYP